MLIRIGIDDLTAVRLVSLICAILSQVIFIALLSYIQKKHYSRLNSPVVQRLFGLPLAAVLIFVLFPSNNAWSMIGLRETTSQFWALVTVFCAVVILIGQRNLWFRVLIAVAGVLSFSALFQSRDEVGFALALALAITAMAWVKNKQSVSVILLLTTVAGAILGAYMAAPTGSRPTLMGSMGIQVTPIDTSPADTSPADTSPADTSPADTSPADTSPADTSPADTSPADTSQSPLDRLIVSIPNRRELLSLDARSAFDPISCPSANGVLSNSVVCEIARFPLALVSVTFRPIWPLDALPADSTISTIATLENFLWLVFFIVTVIALIKNKSIAPRVSLLLVTFVFVFLAGMAISEGNLGTAFRHKSQIIWAVCLLLALSSGPPIRPLFAASARPEFPADDSLNENRP
jgi:hypothetical protein